MSESSEIPIHLDFCLVLSICIHFHVHLAINFKRQYICSHNNVQETQLHSSSFFNGHNNSSAKDNEQQTLQVITILCKQHNFSWEFPG